jgi:hypothetical protein
MSCELVPAEVFVVKAANGDPLLLFGEIEGAAVLWPLAALPRHPIEFARWSKRNVHRWKGRTLQLQHPMCATTRKWVRWLGGTFQGNEVTV